MRGSRILKSNWQKTEELLLLLEDELHFRMQDGSEAGK
jgi:hypothetical protein